MTKAKKIKKLPVFILTIVLLLSLCGTALADPLAELYWQTDPGQDQTDEARDYLDLAGYDANIYGNTSAYYVRRTMDDDAVCLVYGHGFAIYGSTTNYGGGMRSQNGTYVTAESSSYSWAYSLQAKFANTSNKLDDVRFMFFDGCNTGHTNPHYFGNLVTYARGLWADCVLGFDDIIYRGPNMVFVETLFDDTCTNNRTIATGAANALWDAYYAYGNFYGLNTWVWAGSNNILIEPAAYGN